MSPCTRRDMSGFGGGHHSHHGFKLDMGCVERDEDRSEFLSACSRLDEKTVFKMVDVKGGMSQRTRTWSC